MSGSENKELSVDGIQYDDELSLLDLVKFIRHHSSVLLGGALIGGALGLAVAFALSAQWEASALVQVGQVGLVGVEQIEKSNPVESLAKVVDRVTQKSFKDDALKRMSISPDESDPKVDLLLSSLKVKIEKSNLVSMRARGTTPDDAVRFVDALISELADTHAKMTEPKLQRWHDAIEEIDMESRRLNSEIERLNNFLQKSMRESSSANSAQIGLRGSILLAREAELRESRERKRTLQEGSGPERTFPTSPFSKTEVSTQPLFPKKPLFAAGGLVIGLLMAILFSLLRSYVFVYKKR